MGDIAIKVENLSKLYHIGAKKSSSFKEAFSGIFTRNSMEKDAIDFWALNDISFEIKQGEAVGIIGKNGAGKSTLLKILSRITDPSHGRIEINGRVSSLLEVGTGFHPELTGRENIFLNGTILGMTRREVKSRFDEIVDFSGVEKFIDTPVKHYSSGMYVRLAFAVAAHLEPEIMIVDEVLAVGDSEFQKKCLGKMEDVSQNKGRTVIFVSHSMAAVIALCKKGVLLSEGNCIATGPIETIVSQYLSIGNTHKGEVWDLSPVNEQKKLKIRRAKLLNENNEIVDEIDSRNRAFIEVEFEVCIEGKGYNIGFELANGQYGSIFTSTFIDSDVEVARSFKWMKGEYRFRVELPIKILREGDYYINFTSAIPTAEILDIFYDEISFRIIDTNSPVAKTGEGRRGAILPILTWQRF